MAEIEKREEAQGKHDPDYAGRTFTDEQIAARKHRSFVGGGWDEIGKHQFDFLVSRGLKPHHRFLDVGCGSFRAGRHLIDYLDPGNYYGFDVNHAVLEAGYEHELTDDQRKRLPIGNIHSTDRFDADFGVEFDMAIAQSVFTHVSLNHIRLCMYRVAKVMKPGGNFFATFNEHSPKYPLDKFTKTRFTERNAYWYYRRDMRWASRFSPWEFEYVGDWGHPRGAQEMIKLTRKAD